jgi:hypothetical protein
MDKSNFSADTRYTLTVRDAHGRSRAANVYVYRVYDAFMVARATSGDGLLRKIPYAEVERIVDAKPVAAQDRYALQAALLDEKNWRDKTEMQVYASSAAHGK